MAKKKQPGMATTSSSSSSVSNSGQMSNQTSSTGATGAAVNNTNTYVVQGAAGSPGQSMSTTSAPGVNVGWTAGPRNWMDDVITRTIRQYTGK